MKDTFYICKECYHKLHLLGLDLEIITVPVSCDQTCWMCEQAYAEDLINWCVKPQNMTEEA